MKNFNVKVNSPVVAKMLVELAEKVGLKRCNNCHPLEKGNPYFWADFSRGFYNFCRVEMRDFRLVLLDAAVELLENYTETTSDYEYIKNNKGLYKVVNGTAMFYNYGDGVIVFNNGDAPKPISRYWADRKFIKLDKSVKVVVE